MTKKATKKAMPAKKATIQKKATKKAVTKKKTATKKKALARKKTAVKKSTSHKRNTVPAKKVASKKAAPSKRPVSKSSASTTTKKATSRPKAITPIEEPQNNLPPVEEKSPELNSPEVNPVVAHVQGMDPKTNRKEAIRHYNNHNIKLSSVKKGGPKPTGKKPLW